MEVYKKQSCLTAMFKPTSSEEKNQIVAREIEELREKYKEKEKRVEKREKGRSYKKKSNGKTLEM